MEKRVFIIHGWGGSPNEGWFPWLKRELGARGFLVYALNMPHTDTPTIGEWVDYLTEAVGEADENTYLVGHSIGCQTILRMAEGLEEDERLGGAVFVACWFTLLGLQTEEEQEIAR